MDLEVRDLYERYKAELAETVEKLTHLAILEQRAKGLRLLIEGYEVLDPELRNERALTADESALGGESPAIPGKQVVAVTDNVIGALKDHPEEWFTARQMINYFAERNWSATDTAIRLALRRAAERGKAEKSEANGTQTFRWAAEGEVSTS